MSTYKYAQIIAVEYKTGITSFKNSYEGGRNRTFPATWTGVPETPASTANEWLKLKGNVINTFNTIWDKKIGKINGKRLGNYDDLIGRLTYFAYLSYLMKRSLPFNNNDTLKCILWPEFYWCPYANGAYSSAEYRVLKATLRDVLLNQELFKDTLVVNGTIIWELAPNEARIQNQENKKNTSKWRTDPINTTYFNTSLITYKGEGDLIYYPIQGEQNEVNKKGEGSFILQKAYMSWVDGVPDYEYESTDYHIPNVIAANDVNEGSPDYYRTTKAENKHVFKVGGLNVGLEICLEHEETMLSKAILSVLKPKNKNPSILDIQLLTACGMQVNPQSNFTKNHGILGRTDGSDPDSSCLIRVPSDEISPTATLNIDSYANTKIDRKNVFRVYPPQYLNV